jgi:hypothetical protein
MKGAREFQEQQKNPLESVRRHRDISLSHCFSVKWCHECQCDKYLRLAYTRRAFFSGEAESEKRLSARGEVSSQ